MLRLIIIVILAGACYFVYNNWSNITSGFINSAKQEKTVQIVGGTRGELNSEAQKAMERE